VVLLVVSLPMAFLAQARKVGWAALEEAKATSEPKYQAPQSKFPVSRLFEGGKTPALGSRNFS